MLGVRLVSNHQKMPAAQCLGECCKRHPRMCTGALARAPMPTAATGNTLALTPGSSTWASDTTWQHRMSRMRTGVKAGIIYVQIGSDWPPWLRFVLASAAANRPLLNFYFLGPPLQGIETCPNCIWLPLDERALQERIERILGLARGRVKLDSRGRKLCDMKPMWAALFPELTARHEWIGYSDHDVLFGNLSAEVGALSSEDEMMTPLAWFPQPLTNGNLLLVRTVPKMVHAFRRSPVWRQALLQESIWVFDEHWGKAAGLGGTSMHHVYHDMLLSGELRVRPSRRMLVQDIVFMRGKRRKGMYPTIASFGASAHLSWSRGALIAERDGPCVCSAQTWDLDLGSCAECLTQPDQVHQSIRVHRRVEVLGFHFQVFKMHWRAKSTRKSLAEYVPLCAPNVSRFDVDLASGFRCA
jgi:hypothetical protein